MRQNRSLLQSRRVKQRFEDAARRSRRAGDVHPLPVAFEIRVAVAAVGYDLSAFDFDDHGREVANPRQPQFAAPTGRKVLQASLQCEVNVRYGLFPGCRTSITLDQVGGILRHRMRIADQRLFECHEIILFRDITLVPQPGKQPVAFGQQPVAVFAKING